MVASAMAGGTPKLCCSAANHGSRVKSASKVKASVKFLIDPNIRSSTTSFQRSFPIRAQTDDENPSLDEPNVAFIPQEDLSYILKLGGGSVVGAGIIKYGSILFPEITRPNIIQALIMISAPVIIAVFLLIKQSRAKQ